MSVFLKTIKGISLLFIVLSLSACDNMGLWFVNGLARFSDYEAITDISYAKHPLNKLDLYRPSKQTKPLATIIFFYGGCWGNCQTFSKEDYRFVAESLTSLGYLVVIPDYRHYPAVHFPKIIADTSSVVKWVNESIADYGGNPQNIFLMGHSSGAHIAAMLTFNKRYLSPKNGQGLRGFIGLAGAYDFKWDEPYQFELFKAFKDPAYSQPITFVDGHEPPSLLLHGYDDTTVKLSNIVNLTAQIKLKKGQVHSIYYDNIDHVEIISSLSMPLRHQFTVHQDIIKFLTLHRKTVNIEP